MKTKKSILNYITDVIPLLLIMFIGLYKSKYLIINLASNEVGLYQLFSQMLGYITIFESGMTGALLYQFFEPVSKKDEKRINVLYFTGNSVFRIIALIMLAISFTFSFIIPFLIKDNPFSLGYIILCFIMYVSTNIIYYLVTSSKVLLEAQGKKYLTNIVCQGFDVLKSILELFVIIKYKNLILILLVGIITSSLASIIIFIICKSNNKHLAKTKEKDYQFVKNVKNLFVHKIAYLVNNNVDLLLVTKFMGLSQVVVYSSYNFIVNILKKITTRVYVSIVPSLGITLVESKERAKNLFYEINDFIFYMAIIISTSLFLAINSFITIWYEGTIEVSLLLAIGFTLILFINIVIQPLLAYTDASGIFKETRKCAVLEALINLILSLILIKFWGIIGILLATFAGYLISDIIIRSKVIFNNIFKSNTRKYYLKTFLYIIIFFIICFIEYLLTSNIHIDNMFNWFVYNCFYGIFNIILVTIIFKLTNSLSFFNKLFNLLKGRIKNEKN